MKPARLVFLGVAVVLLAFPPAASAQPAPADLVALRAKAALGDPHAQYNLGLALTRNPGAAADRVEAFVWLTLAAEGGATDKALETVLDTLSPPQVAEVRRRVAALRAGNPALRPAAVIGTTPIIAAPAATAVPVIAVPAPEKALHDQLAAALKEKSQLATELAVAWKEIEEHKGKLTQHAASVSDLAAAQKAFRETQATLARQSTEIAATRAEAASTKIELGKAQSQLTAARADLTAGQDAKAKAESALAAAEKIASARAEDLGKLRADATAQELTALRDRATAAREFEARIRQLEGEKSALTAAAAATAASPGISADEFARATKALADSEGKLATALRSYTLLTAERDELRAAVADLSAKLAAANEPRPVPSLPIAAAPAPDAVRTAVSSPAAVPPREGSPIRPTAVGAPTVRTHTIAVGDTLSGLSRRYYGTPNRWPEILAANRDVLPDERSLVAGKVLRIP